MFKANNSKAEKSSLKKDNNIVQIQEKIIKLVKISKVFNKSPINLMILLSNLNKICHMMFSKRKGKFPNWLRSFNQLKRPTKNLRHSSANKNQPKINWFLNYRALNHPFHRMKVKRLIKFNNCKENLNNKERTMKNYKREF